MNTDFELDFIQIEKDLLVKYTNKKDGYGGLLDCFSTKKLRKVANILKAESIHVYLFNFRKDTILEKHIIGDKTIWDKIDILKLQNDISYYGDFIFFKIKHITRDGNSINFGYIGVYKDGITKYEMSHMSLLCLIYGNLLSSVIIRHLNERYEILLPKTIEKLTVEKKPGTALVNVIRSFYQLSGYSKLYYFSIDSMIWTGEYLQDAPTSRFTYCLALSKQKKRRIVVDKEFNHILKKSDSFLVFDGNNLPNELNKFVFYNFIGDRNIYECHLYPIKFDGDLIGAWVAINSKQNVDFYNGESFLRSIYPLMRLNYKYIYQKSSKKMIIDPMFIDRDTRIKEKEVFVIMPFTEEWSDIVWSHMITPVVESMGLKPFRADNLYGPKIMEDIWKGILHSSIVIADITGRNPNVFYELGIAHTLGKKVILLTQNVEDIPFDLRHLRHIIYKTDIVGADKFKPELINFINEQLNSSAN